MLSVDHHLHGFRVNGEEYLSSAFAKNGDGEEKGYVIRAALKYLSNGVQKTASNAPSQLILHSQAASQHTHISSFLSTLAAAIDFDLPVDVLVSTAIEAADQAILPVATKCLCILAKKQSVPCNKSSRKSNNPSSCSPNSPRRADSSSEAADCRKHDEDEENSDERVSVVKENATGAGEGISGHSAVQGRTGQAFVDDFLIKLVQVDPNASCMQAVKDDVFVATLAREAPLSSGAIKPVLMNLLYRMRNVNVFELPAYIYQTLLIVSSRGNPALKRKFVLCIANLFHSIEEKTKSNEEATQNIFAEDEDAIVANTLSTEELRQIEGTALFHVEYALKQDPTLVVELLKLMKAGTESQMQFMTPFGIAVFMIVAKSPASQEEVLGLIRESLSKFEKERSIRKRNLFSARVTINEEELCPPSLSILEAAERVGGNGWECIAEPLFQFSLLLLDKPIPSERSLGADLLRVLFRQQSAMRRTIMEQISSRIALRGRTSLAATILLSRLTSEMPLNVLEQSSFIRQCIEDSVRLPPALASSLIDALKPIIHARRDILDYFILVMRKALFHRETSDRAVASYGFLSLLSLTSPMDEDREEESLNQQRLICRNSFSARAALAESDLMRIRAVCQPLRRCLTYSPALRALLYKNIYTVMNRMPDSPARNESCLALRGLLRPHLLGFISPQRAPYVLLERCVDEGNGLLREPLGDLINCVSVVESTLLNEDPEASYLLDLARKVASVSVRDFPISKDIAENTNGSAEDASDTDKLAVNVRVLGNRNNIRVLGNVVEALISVALYLPSKSHKSELFATIVFPLLSLREELVDILKCLGYATAEDAIRDLGGDALIESEYSVPNIRRAGRPIGFTKKQSNTSKNPKKGISTEVQSLSSSIRDYRFGVFNVLISAAHSPLLPVSTALKALNMVSCLTSESQSDELGRFFREPQNELNVANFHSYLLAVAMKHVENANDVSERNKNMETFLEVSQKSLLSDAVCDISRIAMKDFRDSRRLSGAQALSDRLRSLHIVEACTKAVIYIFGRCSAVLDRLASAMLLQDAGAPNSIQEAAFSALKAIEQLAGTLLSDSCYKECHSVLRILDLFFDCIEWNSKLATDIEQLRQRKANWALKMLTEHEIVDPVIIKILTTMSLVYTENNDDLRNGARVIARLHSVIGDCDATAQIAADSVAEGAPFVLKSIVQGNSLMALDGVLDSLDHALADVEWSLSRMSSIEAIYLVASDLLEHDSRVQVIGLLREEKNLARVFAQRAVRSEDAAETRLEGVVRNLQALSCCAIAKWTHQERLLKCCIKAYKLASSATQAQCKRKGDPRTCFLSLLDACKRLGPSLWTYLAFLGTEGAREGRSGKVSREARIMPQLVYEVERFEKLLISAQKHTRINLLRGMRRNTARDFRIHEDLLREDRVGEAHEPAESQRGIPAHKRRKTTN